MIKRLLISTLLLLPVSVSADYSTRYDYNSKQKQIDTIKAPMAKRSYSKLYDGRYYPTTNAEFIELADHVENHDTSKTQTYGIYYLDMSLTIPDNFWTKDSAYIYFYYCDWSNVTGTASLPDIPVVNSDFVRVYFNVRRAAGNSIGSAGINDVPITWRNAKDWYYFNFQRQELSSAQQVGIVEGIEREILAGLSENYTSTSTTARVITFSSTSTGRNDALVQADLVALGWTIISPTILSKTIINPSNGVGYVWRVQHTN